MEKWFPKNNVEAALPAPSPELAHRRDRSEITVHGRRGMGRITDVGGAAIVASGIVGLM